MKEKICRKCLLGDLDEDDFIRAMKERIAEYPADKRTEESEYRRRLEICRGCEHLGNGMCALCGCYVELRAIKRQSFCPGRGDKWKAGK